MDEKGYVLSGLGMLLIIPVMIMIPIALSVTNQSSDLPNTFVKSDSAFYANNNIQSDMSIKLSNFLINITNANYIWNNPNPLANNITLLFNTTNSAYYMQNNIFGIDELSINPTNPTQITQIYYDNSTYPTLPTSGIIVLENGISIQYIFSDNNTVNNEYFYDYTVFPVINSTITTTKSNAGHVQNYVDINSSTTITIDAGNIQSSVPSNIKDFFTRL